MNLWPNDFHFKWDTIQFSRTPEVNRTEAMTQHRRQRRRFKSTDDVFSVDVLLKNERVAAFRAFVKANPSRFIGPYYDCDVVQTAQMQIVGGYSLTEQPPFHHIARITLEVFDVSHAMGEQLYNLAESMGDDFANLSDITEALAIAVNENEL